MAYVKKKGGSLEERGVVEDWEPFVLVGEKMKKKSFLLKI